jgi:hypothetical protein
VLADPRRVLGANQLDVIRGCWSLLDVNEAGSSGSFIDVEMIGFLMSASQSANRLFICHLGSLGIRINHPLPSDILGVETGM